MKVNFGGFVPLSTVDWRGRAVCTVFLRGCPVRCDYCHNRSIQDGEDFRSIEEVISLIHTSRLLVSGVVFSGGEPTLQKAPLLALASACRKMGLAIGVQTNGVFPATLEALLERRLVDRIALDLKTRWERYDNLLKRKFVDKVQRSLLICRQAYEKGELPEFEVVITLFRGCEDEAQYIAREANGVDLVLQQGVLGTIAPLTLAEMKRVGDQLGRRVKIRTREEGEVEYEGDRSRWIARER
ncbi:MAG: anaerobic ribonucleoside-triphosphate reductase activating protein [Methanomicrobiales archaeon]|nr:anaerobic ribonucleoside-triphosphate reductase activating protein [Methanomicrobiales archaeon]MDI6876524.1 anaerobic ribonucleoside-triphosphate reductase activating protein [Methanomicrobiales archaeon]